MYKEQITAIGHQLKGAAKAGAGRLLGDAKLMADGAAELAAGRAESALARVEDPLFPIDQDRVEGVGHQMRGALKQTFGTLVGARTIEADGIAERASGKLQNEAGSERDERREAAQHTVDQPKP
jgi:uncharacterized protein YjbJ (UPF0337 family)